jgi:hypothetical protein
MRYYVYHLTTKPEAAAEITELNRLHTWSMSSKDAADMFNGKHPSLIYRWMADVETDRGIEGAYEATNNIDQLWIHNPGVIRRRRGEHRSTSVGDIIKNSYTGEYYLCRPQGWELVKGIEFMKRHENRLESMA